MRSALLVVLTSCALPDEGAAPVASEDLVLYRVEHGDSIGYVADRLGFRGGYRALMAANGKQSSELRSGEGLRIPIARLRDAVAVRAELAAGITDGVFAELSLEPFDSPLPADPLLPCATLSARGMCVELGTTVACIEETPPRGDPDPDEDLSIRYCNVQHDGATDCGSRAGRELALYRDGTRTVLAPLPGQGGELIAHRVDLDGDRGDELVFAVELEVSHHRNDDYSRVIVVGDRGTTQLDIIEFGAGSLVEADGACDVLATDWDSGQLQPLEPMGTYLVGRRLAYRNGELVPRGDRTVRRMRDLFHLAPPDEERPASLLRVDSSRWPDRAQAGDYRRGRVTAVEPLPGGIAITIAFPDGTTTRFAPDVDAESTPAGAARLDAMHWAATGSRMPEAYFPADPARWVGSEVMVDRPAPCEGCGLYYELWLDPR